MQLFAKSHSFQRGVIGSSTHTFIHYADRSRKYSLVLADPGEFSIGVLEYQNFLMMVCANRQHRRWPKCIVPTERADEIWHQHILHTQEYMDFCQNLFGGTVKQAYLHHNPGLEKGSDAFMAACEHTEFVHQYIEQWAFTKNAFGNAPLVVKPASHSRGKARSGKGSISLVGGSDGGAASTCSAGGCGAACG